MSMDEALSAREVEILRLAADGYTNGESAIRLSLSLNTIKWYTKQIYEKLAVKSRAQAIKRAQQLGVLAPPDVQAKARSANLTEADGSQGKQTPSQHHLPTPLTPLIGRRTEVDKVKQLLWHHRLLTLTGPGGIGKTRLALQVAAEVATRFPDGLYFVDLAPVADAALVSETIAHTLNLTDAPNLPLPTRLQKALQDKQILLILDNFEHLLAAAPLVADLLAATQELTLLATSREALALHGEQEYALPPLELPDLEWFAAPHLAPTDLLHGEALQLFEQCAQAVAPDFRLTAENAPAAASICLRLDGLPLAIELAAAYVKLFSPQTMFHQLDAMWLEMKHSARNVPVRQQTLRNAIEWSYRLLTEEEQRLLRQLSIFRGGCTLAAIGAVCEEDSPWLLLERLRGLVNKSLIWQREDSEGQPRFGMLETIRHYAFSALAALGQATPLRQRHAAYFLALVEEGAPHLIGPQQQSWLPRLEREHANLRAALTSLLHVADSVSALRLATALQQFWDYRGYVSEGRAWFDQALAQAAVVDGPTHARALLAVGWLAYRQGDFLQAQAHYVASLQLFEMAEAEMGIADALQMLAIIDSGQGNYAIAQERLIKSLQLARKLQHEHGIARALRALGALAWDQDHYAEARDYHRECLLIEQKLDHQANIAIANLCVGDTERMLGDLDAARIHYTAAHTTARALGHKGLIGAALKNLGKIAAIEQDYAQAWRACEEALAIFREVGDKIHVGFTLSELGSIANQLGETSQAFAYWAQDLQIMYEVGYKWPIFESLENIACLLADVGAQAEAAVRFLGAADQLHQETGIPLAPHRQQKVTHTLTTLQQQVDGATFHQLWEVGRNAPLAQIVADVIALSLIVGEPVVP